MRFYTRCSAFAAQPASLFLLLHPPSSPLSSFSALSFSVATGSFAVATGRFPEAPSRSPEDPGRSPEGPGRFPEKPDPRSETSAVATDDSAEDPELDSRSESFADELRR